MDYTTLLTKLKPNNEPPYTTQTAKDKKSALNVATRMHTAITTERLILDLKSENISNSAPTDSLLKAPARWQYSESRISLSNRGRLHIPSRHTY